MFDRNLNRTILTVLLRQPGVAPSTSPDSPGSIYPTPTAPPEGWEYRAAQGNRRYKHRHARALSLTVGYRRVREAGKVEGFCADPPETSVAPDANHGKVSVPTSLSLNVAYRMWLPSCELQRASGVVRTSSEEKRLFSIESCLYRSYDWSNNKSAPESNS